MVRTAPIVPAALLDPVVDYFHPRRIILSGSVARGESGSNSDFDLMVILDDDAPREKVSLAAGFEARRSFKQAADVIPCRESVFLRKARIPGTLAHEAASAGVVVYERPQCQCSCDRPGGNLMAALAHKG